MTWIVGQLTREFSYSAFCIFDEACFTGSQIWVIFALLWTPDSPLKWQKLNKMNNKTKSVYFSWSEMRVFIFLGEKNEHFLGNILFRKLRHNLDISHSHIGQRIEWIWESGKGEFWATVFQLNNNKSSQKTAKEVAQFLQISQISVSIYLES